MATSHESDDSIKLELGEEDAVIIGTLPPPHPHHAISRMPTPPPMIAASQSSVPPPPEKKLSHVNGTGLWNSWKRNFKSTELALLDLFDNAMDATMQDNNDQFRGKIDIYRDDDSDDALCMRNNCVQPIPTLEKVLEVFGSQKTATDIGENGVGIKQACAAVSDLSIVLTKNQDVIQIGFICKELQTMEECCLPSYTLRGATLEDDLQVAIQGCIQGCQKFRTCLQIYNTGRDDGADSSNNVGPKWIVKHIQSLNQMEDEYIFLVLMHNVLQCATLGGLDGVLSSLRKALPRTYLHVPSEMTVMVDGHECKFQHWERKLVELHHFSLSIDKEHSNKITKGLFVPPNEGDADHVKLFVGFDPERARADDTRRQNKAALLIYSRKCGRLVVEHQDARGLLGLSNSGTVCVCEMCCMRPSSSFRSLSCSCAGAVGMLGFRTRLDCNRG